MSGSSLALTTSSQPRDSGVFGAGTATTSTTLMVAANDITFEELVPIHLRKEDRQQSRIELTVLVAVQKRNTSRRVVIQVTDPSDYLLFFAAHVDEEDYPRFREDNRLHFDFNAFPIQLATLLRECIKHGKQEFPSHFISLGIERASGRLQVLQSDTFCERQMLCLILQRQTNEDHIRLLADKLKATEGCERQLRRREMDLVTELERLKELRAQEQHRSSQEINELSARIRQIEEAKKTEVAETSHQCLARATAEQKDLEERYRAQLNALQQSLQSRQTDLIQLTETKGVLESELRETRQQLYSIKESHRQTVLERDSLRTHNADLAAQNTEMAKQLDALRHQVTTMQKELLARDQLIESTKALASEHQLSRRQLEETCEDLRSRIQDLSEKLQREQRQHTEQQKVTAQLSQTYKAARDKAKQRQLQINAMEQKLRSKDQQLERAEHDLEMAEDRVHQKQRQCEDLESRLQKLESEKTQLAEKLGTSEKTIHYLSHQINEQKSGHALLASALSPISGVRPLNVLGLGGSTGPMLNTPMATPAPGIPSSSTTSYGEYHDYTKHLAAGTAAASSTAGSGSIPPFISQLAGQARADSQRFFVSTQNVTSNANTQAIPSNGRATVSTLVSPVPFSLEAQHKPTTLATPSLAVSAASTNLSALQNYLPASLLSNGTTNAAARTSSLGSNGLATGTTSFSSAPATVTKYLAEAQARKQQQQQSQLPIAQPSPSGTLPTPAAANAPQHRSISPAESEPSGFFPQDGSPQ